MQRHARDMLRQAVAAVARRLPQTLPLAVSDGAPVATAAAAAPASRCESTAGKAWQHPGLLGSIPVPTAPLGAACGVVAGATVSVGFPQQQSTKGERHHQQHQRRQQPQRLLHAHCAGQFDPSSSRQALFCPDSHPTNLLVGKQQQCQQRQQNRGFSNLPETTVYGGPRAQLQNGAAAAAGSSSRVTLRVLGEKYRRNEPITMVTAYDYPSAVHVDQAGIDICLVGDSVSMVVHGHDTTLPVTMEDMLLHCRAVARGAQRPILVGDLPFGSYEQSAMQAVDSAVRMLKEGSMDAVKIEGGIPARVAAARAIAEAGIAVMGHVGLTPQAISSLGGFRPQARTADNALKVIDHALALQDAGCFSVVLECIPAPVAAAITAALDIPTIGIGAGPHCSGQVLVYHDLLGMMQHPHHAKVTPKFCKGYGRIGEAIQTALNAYREEVTSRAFPSREFSPYSISDREHHAFVEGLRSRGLPVPSEAVPATVSASPPSPLTPPSS